MDHWEDQSYGVLAAHYDALMAHVDYNAWVDYALKRLGLPLTAPPEKKTLVDLGCGTGTVAIQLAKRGYDVIGIDGSPAMLSVARQKAEDSGVALTLYHQSLTEFDVGHEIDGIVCLCDTFNYLTGDGELSKALACVAQTLKPGRSVVFDLHTESRMRQMDEAVFADELDDVAYIWESDYDDNQRLCTMYVTLFVHSSENIYRRYQEVHQERAYSPEEVEQALSEAGLRLTGFYGDLSDSPPAVDESRVFYTAMRPSD